MASEKWECMEVHSKNHEQWNRSILQLVVLLREMKQTSHLKTYFFNRYSDPDKGLYFTKLGLVNGDDIAKSELNSLFDKQEVLVKPYVCEMWEVDGVSIDKIKCTSCDMFEKVRDAFGEKPSIQQVAYILHFLMN